MKCGSLLKIPATNCLLFLGDDKSINLSKSRVWRMFSPSMLLIYGILRAPFSRSVQLIEMQIYWIVEKCVPNKLCFSI